MNRITPLALATALLEADPLAIPELIANWPDPVPVATDAIVRLVGRDSCYGIWFKNPLPTIDGQGNTVAVNVTVDLNGHDVGNCQVHVGTGWEFCGDCSANSIERGEPLRYQWADCFGLGVNMGEWTLLCSFELDNCQGPLPFIVPSDGCDTADTIYAEPHPAGCTVGGPVIEHQLDCGASLATVCE